MNLTTQSSEAYVPFVNMAIAEHQIMDGVVFFAGQPDEVCQPVKLLQVEGNECGIVGDGGVSYFLDDTLLQGEREVFGFSLQE
jgi:hypothetical protein